MAPRPGQKEESRARILASAGRGFRARGYGGLGVDGLAKEAGVTSGAFYAHFKSKAAAFTAAVAKGMNDLLEGIRGLQASHGAGWRTAFIDFYLSDRLTCALDESCAMQSLTNEVARAEPEAREAYEAEFRQVIAATAQGTSRAEALALLALLSGGVSLARAVQDPALSAEIAEAVRAAATRLGAEA